jgi:Na+-translocating ferredoxin:NAD+ oxidoreductase subunit E
MNKRLSKKTFDDSYLSIMFKGILEMNPIFKLALGLCPTLAISTTLTNSFNMSIAVLFVLFLSNVIISMFKLFIPKQIRIPVYIVIISTFVTVVDLIMNAYTPSAHAMLGIYLPLIIVNCIILSRVEIFASKNNVFKSMLDAIGMSVGFGLAICFIGSIREFLSSGALYLFDIKIINLFNPTIMPSFMNLAPGAFLTMGFIIAFINYIKYSLEDN